jgi:hypothetical protein
MALHPTIQDRLDRAATRWRWLRFLQRTATLGIIVTALVLLLGLAIVCGLIKSKGTVTACLWLLVGGGLLASTVSALIVVACQFEQARLARAIERVYPALLDRLNTLVFLGGRKNMPHVESFYDRIEGQTRSVLGEGAVPSPFSPTHALAHICVLALLLIATVWFYIRLTPFDRLHGVDYPRAKLFEMPPTKPPAKALGEPAPWAEIRFAKPGRDLTVTRIEAVPLQIEASASKPIERVTWYTAINAGEEQSHDLPAPSDPHYSVYQPVIDVPKFGLGDWDVLTYYAKAQTEDGGSFVSKAYFLEVQPFRKELQELPGGQEGEFNSISNQLTNLIQHQQKVVQEMHRQQHSPGQQSDMQDHDPKGLAGTESKLADATRHLAMRIPAEFPDAGVEEPVSRLERAEESLRGAASAFLKPTPSEATREARNAFADLLAARKLLQKRIIENPGAFAPQEEQGQGTPRETAEALKRMREVGDEIKTAGESVRDLAARQRKLSKRTRNRNLEYKSIFTRGLDVKNAPVDDVTDISIDEKRVYIHTTWRSFSPEQHDYLCRAYDGSGKNVETSGTTFTPSAKQYPTWTWLDLDKSAHVPGKWKFEVYLDDGKVLEEYLEVQPGKLAGALKLIPTPQKDFRRVADEKDAFRRLSEEEDGFRGELAELQGRHPRAFRRVQTRWATAKDGLGQAADSLRREQPESEQRTTVAAEQLEALAKALEDQLRGRNLADAYRLKGRLDEQVKLLEQLEQQPDSMTAEQLEQASQNIKEITGQLKSLAEDKPMKECFGNELREALNDENKRAIDSQCDSLCRAQGGEARKQAADSAKAAVQRVCQAFAASQPEFLAALQQSAAFQQDAQPHLESAISRLERLLESREDGRLPPDGMMKVQQEVFGDIEQEISRLPADNPGVSRLFRALRESYGPGADMDLSVIQKLVEQLKNLRVELIEQRSGEADEPDLRHIDPAKFAPAYRDRIRKYFEKLSEE